MIKQISSRHNKVIKEIESLFQKKHRDESGLFVVEGEKTVGEIPSDFSIRYLFLSEDFYQSWDGQKHHDQNHPSEAVYICENKLYQSLSQLKNPEGILAVVEKPRYDFERFLEEKHFWDEKHLLDARQNQEPFKQGLHFCVLCEETNDPGNLGTIIRTAHAAGAQAVLLSHGCADVYNPKTLRAAAGSAFHIPIFEIDFAKYLPLLASKLTLIGSDLQASQSLYETDLTKPLGILIGNEARGISQGTRQACTQRVKIPMPGNAESLNASISAGIMIYEAVRQRYK